MQTPLVIWERVCSLVPRVQTEATFSSYAPHTGCGTSSQRTAGPLLLSALSDQCRFTMTFNSINFLCVTLHCLVVLIISLFLISFKMLLFCTDLSAITLCHNDLYNLLLLFCGYVVLNYVNFQLSCQQNGIPH